MYFSGSVTQRIQVCNRMLTPTSCYRPVDILLCTGTNKESKSDIREKSTLGEIQLEKQNETGQW